MLDANSAVMTAELEKDNSAVATAELLTVDNETDIFHTMQVANVAEFPNRYCSLSNSKSFLCPICYT